MKEIVPSLNPSWGGKEGSWFYENRTWRKSSR